jgi:putative intracellular protease/amidase
MGRAILIVLTNTRDLPGPHLDGMAPDARRTGFDIKEAALAYHYFHKVGGLELNLASPSGGECYIDPRALKAAEHEEEVQAFLADQCAMQWIKCTDQLGHFDLERFQAVLFIGGPGAMFDFPRNRELREVANHIYQKGGIIAAIGHGAAALLDLKDPSGAPLIKNKQVTANTTEEDSDMHLEKDLPFSIERKLSEIGAEFKKASKFANNVVVDGRIITGQNRNSTRDWIRQIDNHLQK